MEMVSLGKKVGSPIEATSKSKEMYYPSFTITEDVMSELKGKTVGDKITMTIDCQLGSISSYGNGDIEYRLDIHKAGIKEE